MDSPEFEQKILMATGYSFDSHMRRAEPRTPERYSAKLRRRSYSYSLGLTPSGQLDMGLCLCLISRITLKRLLLIRKSV